MFRDYSSRLTSTAGSRSISACGFQGPGQSGCSRVQFDSLFVPDYILSVESYQSPVWRAFYTSSGGVMLL
jgi:hypothetical protein